MKVWGSLCWFFFFISFCFNIQWKWNNLVSLRPNYFIFIGYLNTLGREGVRVTPHEPPLDPPLLLWKKNDWQTPFNTEMDNSILTVWICTGWKGWYEVKMSMCSLSCNLKNQIKSAQIRRMWLSLDQPLSNACIERFNGQITQRIVFGVYLYLYFFL